jgi:hypothetical protein
MIMPAAARGRPGRGTAGKKKKERAKQGVARPPSRNERGDRDRDCGEARHTVRGMKKVHRAIRPLGTTLGRDRISSHQAADSESRKKIAEQCELDGRQDEEEKTGAGDDEREMKDPTGAVPIGEDSGQAAGRGGEGGEEGEPEGQLFVVQIEGPLEGDDIGLKKTASEHAGKAEDEHDKGRGMEAIVAHGRRLYGHP